ncbi:DUF692 domain-containing protein [Teredinibacter waterburyi]|uniref:MNIO family bufferin maturase n=1 Tax=Teredinibacter waterburyi TaxID=1500538 RepID=UPI00165F4AA6|nr:DUF692 domain-containing protein [Teredinibacter waterburyi]
MKPTFTSSTEFALPNTCGIGLRAPHYQSILTDRPDIAWLEIHPENFMVDGGPSHHYLTAIKEHYPLSMHGVGMSLGSANGVSIEHLISLKKLVDRYQPLQVSEHLSWSHGQDIFLNDLLPLPYTDESLKLICHHLNQVQSFLDRKILVENPSTYIDFANSDYSETEFLKEICKQTGCGLLLDVNNVFVSAYNNGFDPYHYLDNFPHSEIGEVHLAGHSLYPLTKSAQIRIDDHGAPVAMEVWALYEHLLSHCQCKLPTLIEWDTNIPPLETLLIEATKAEARMKIYSVPVLPTCV